MHLKVGVVVVIVAVAAGAAAGRATAPHVSIAANVAAAASTPSSPAGLSFDASEATTDDATRAFKAGVRGPGAGPTSAAARAVVYVAGAVARPGVYALRATARADDALRAAGGATAAADLVAINLAARVEDGEEIAVPVNGAGATVRDGAISQTKKRARHARKRGHRRKRPRQSDDVVGAADTSPATDAPAEMVDVNAADEATLETLPGVGPSLAQRIIAFRDLNGPFASTDELLDVGGMTAGKVDAVSPYVTFH